MLVKQSIKTNQEIILNYLLPLSLSLSLKYNALSLTISSEFTSETNSIFCLTNNLIFI